jgi:hypothetical protein
LGCINEDSMKIRLTEVSYDDPYRAESHTVRCC